MFIDLVFLSHVCMWGGACTRRSEDNWQESVLAFHHGRLGNVLPSVYVAFALGSPHLWEIVAIVGANNEGEFLLSGMLPCVFTCTRVCSHVEARGMSVIPQDSIYFYVLLMSFTGSNLSD